MDRFLRQVASVGSEAAAILSRVPDQHSPPLRPDWLRCEMLERFLLLKEASIPAGTSVLEVAAGPHAITTVPLAALVGEGGTVVAVERERWGHFREVVGWTGMGDRVSPVMGDAGALPFRTRSLSAAFCVHGIRSLGEDDSIVRILREMLRVASSVFLAESLPEARSDAQKAHLAMYDLRSKVFEARTGKADDLPYRPLGQLRMLVERSGGKVRDSKVIDVDLPHALAYFPRKYAEGVSDPDRRQELLQRWDRANQLAHDHGVDHPPVGIVQASR